MPPSSVSAEKLLSYSERASSRQGQLTNLRTGSGTLPNTGHLPFTIRKHDWPIGNQARIGQSLRRHGQSLGREFLSMPTTSAYGYRNRLAWRLVSDANNRRCAATLSFYLT